MFVDISEKHKRMFNGWTIGLHQNHTVLDCRVRVLFQSFVLLLQLFPLRRQEGWPGLWTWLLSDLPLHGMSSDGQIFKMLQVLGLVLQAPVQVSLSQLQTQPPSPTQSQAKLTSGNDRSNVIYSLRGNWPSLQKSLNFMCFHYHEMEVLYLVKTEVTPVQVGKLGRKSYLVPFLDPLR